MNLKNKSENYINLTKLPNNFAAEQSILSILLTNPQLIKDIVNLLKINSFYFEEHKLIYKVFLTLLEENNSINLTNLISKLQDEELLEKIGGIEKIILILNAKENPFELQNYISKVNEKYFRRLLIDLGKQIISSSYISSKKIDDILEIIENTLTTLNQEKFTTKVASAAEIIDEVYSELKNKIQKNETVGLETTFKDLDSILQGFQKSDLIIIAGRPSMGKTAFALNLAKNIVVKYNIPLLIFSLEMSRQQIIYRFLASESNINSNRLKSGRMNKLEWGYLSNAMKQISELPLFIEDNSNITINDIRLKLKNIVNNKNKNALIIIDYLQLMKVNLKLENRVQEISYITRNLKILAKEFQVPILLLSQLSRNVESRVNKRPMLSDLRESGCLTKLKDNNLKKFIIWNKSYFINSHESINYSFKGIKPTFTIYFENNQNLKLTANHKILSTIGWIRISEITSRIKIYKCFYDQKSFLVTENKIKKISYNGLEAVYDKTIPLFHNYLEKDIILHNSIEQDADIVIMLYREEYYTQKTSEPHITEFILAKHRNGPVGTVSLLFNPITTTFRNI